MSPIVRLSSNEQGFHPGDSWELQERGSKAKFGTSNKSGTVLICQETELMSFNGSRNEGPPSLGQVTPDPSSGRSGKFNWPTEGAWASGGLKGADTSWAIGSL
jgi:hypothetical protein